MTPPPRPHTPVRDGCRLSPPGPLASTATAVVTALALAGCSTGGAEPPSTPTATAAVATPSPDPTPSPTRSPKPERPAAMDDASVEGAIAAATYFISLYPYVYNTGDLAEWEALSHPECVFCASVAESVADMHSTGETQYGADSAVTSSEAVEIDSAWFSVELGLIQEPWSVVDRSGITVRENTANYSYRMSLAVIREDGAWRVRAAQATDA